MALTCSFATACVEEPSVELRFESWYCGRRSCDLNEALSVGSSLVLGVRADAGSDILRGATFESSDPSIVRINGVAPGSSRRVDVSGLAEGDAELMVRDKEGRLLDTLLLRVRTAERLDLAFSLVTVGTLEELPTPTPGIDRELEVSANTRIRIETIAMAGDEPLVGIFDDHIVEIRSTAPADDQLQFFPEEAKLGRFEVRVSAYDHDLTIRRGDLATTVRLHGRDSSAPAN